MTVIVLMHRSYGKNQFFIVDENDFNICHLYYQQQQQILLPSFPSSLVIKLRIIINYDSDQIFHFVNKMDKQKHHHHHHHHSDKNESKIKITKSVDEFKAPPELSISLVGSTNTDEQHFSDQPKHENGNHYCNQTKCFIAQLKLIFFLAVI